MAQLVNRDQIESMRMELAEIGRSVRSSFRQSVSSFRSNSVRDKEDEDEELQWAAIERLPTFERIRSSLLDVSNEGGEKRVVVDVTKLGALERHVLIEKLIKHIEEDNRLLLQKLRERLDRVDVKLPTVEVRYQNLSVEAECEVVQGKPLPTLWNSTRSMFSGTMTKLCRTKSEEAKMSILKDVNGVIKPSR